MRHSAFLAILALMPGFVTMEALGDPPASMPASAAATAGIDHLRDAIESAYNSGDTERMLAYIHPDAVIIFPDGRILKGPQGLRDYYQKMMTGPGHVVASYSAQPVVQSRTIHGDVALSYGLMNDHYVLNDGRQFDLNSRFTVTVVRSPHGPADTDGWMIRSFHSSSDLFDNPILSMAIHKSIAIAGAIGLVVGALITGLVLLIFRRRRGYSKPTNAEV